MFFDLEGANVTYVRQKVVSESIQESSAAWWEKRHAKLQGATGITVASASKTALDDGGENDGTSYAKELVGGSIADWMQGVGANTQIVEADVTYTKSGSTKTETLRLTPTGTNANNQIYASVGSASPAEPTPAGLAAAILASIVALQYQGQLILTEADAGAERLIDKKLNISGGRAEWASMDAQIYSVTLDLDAGRTTINFGPAKHLGANDLFQLFRNVRTRSGASATARINSGAGGTDLPTRTPNTHTADDGGGNSSASPLQGYKTGDGKLKVKPGTVNSVEATGTDQEVSVSDGAKAWVKVTLDTGGSVTAVAITAIDPGADTATQTSQQIYTISGSGASMVINNMLGGSQNVDSCGASHSWNRV